MSATDIFKNVERFTVRNSPAILTGIAVTGSVTTAIFAGRASYKAAELIIAHEHEAEQQQAFSELEVEIPEFTTKDKVQLTWQLYIPAVGMGATTVVAMIVATQIGTRRAAAMAAAYSLSERAFTEYRDKVTEKLGERKSQEIRDEIAQDRVNANPNAGNTVVVSSQGVLCYDQYTGRYFTSSMEDIKKAQNDFNYQLIRESYASLNEFYDRLSLDWTSVGDSIGWTVDAPLELSISTVISDDGKPCLAIDFQTPPVANFSRGH